MCGSSFGFQFFDVLYVSFHSSDVLEMGGLSSSLSLGMSDSSSLLSFSPTLLLECLQVSNRSLLHLQGILGVLDS